MKEKLIIDDDAKLLVQSGVEIILLNDIQVRGSLVMDGDKEDRIYVHQQAEPRATYIRFTTISENNMIRNAEFSKTHIAIAHDTLIEDIFFSNASLNFNGDDNVIKNSKLKDSSVEIRGQNNNIRDTVFDGGQYDLSKYGIYVYEKAYNTVIDKSIIKNMPNSGIWVYEPNTRINNSSIVGNGTIGIDARFINFFSEDTNFTIENTIVSGNETGIIISDGAGFTHIINCEVSENGVGINFKKRSLPSNGQFSTISGTDIYNNLIGLNVENIDQHIIKNNNIYSNNQYNLIAPVGITTMDYSGNYWGTDNEEEIGNYIFNFYNDYDYVKTEFKPFLTTPYTKE